MSVGLDFEMLVPWLTIRLRRIERFFRTAALQPTYAEESSDRKDGQLGGHRHEM